MKTRKLARSITIKPERGIDICLPVGTEVIARYIPEKRDYRILDAPD